ncbi:MAG TPA: LytTR family DNA-binding domain-containing protein [Gemmatimonadaceae bacterium]|nr:LytTR family DNA-binding domain-containing protein [Gemmatimonadaceae bacterium]
MQTSTSARSPDRRFTVVVVDDEELARRRISQLIAGEDDMEMVAECRDGRDGIAAVEAHRPDVLFLDVQMPGVDGFALLAAVATEPPPAVVFVTAHDQHAIRAFEVDAIDYLLKPFDEERFHQSLARVREHLHQSRSIQADPRLLSLLELVADREPAVDSALARPRYVDRLMIKTGTKTVVVRATDIDRIEAEGNYVRLYVEAKSYLLRETMSRIEKSLNPSTFARIHRSSIVNLERVREVEPYFGHDFMVRLSTGARVKMSRWYRDEFEMRMRHGAG